MTTYRPKPGDRVVSPLLVGEWVVENTWNRGRKATVTQGDVSLDRVPTIDLTPVAPPLPPEPAVGSVVRAHGRLWGHTRAGWLHLAGTGYDVWRNLATAPDLSPVVPVDDVADWMNNGGSCCGDEQAITFRAEFGGWDK